MCSGRARCRRPRGGASRWSRQETTSRLDPITQGRGHRPACRHRRARGLRHHAGPPRSGAGGNDRRPRAFASLPRRDAGRARYGGPVRAWQLDKARRWPEFYRERFPSGMKREPGGAALGRGIRDCPRNCKRPFRTSRPYRAKPLRQTAREGGFGTMAASQETCRSGPAIPRGRHLQNPPDGASGKGY